MEGLEIRSITVANLPDLAAPCILSGTLGCRMTLDSETAETMIRGKLSFFHDRMRQGAAAMAAYLAGRPVGLLEYYPIEVAPYPVIGRDLFVINCLQVPERSRRETLEKELVASCIRDWSSRKGVVVLGRRKPWDALGFEAVGRDAWPDGEELTLWLMKFWEVEEPRLAPVNYEFTHFRGKTKVDIFESGHCPWDIYVADLVARVAESLGSKVILERVDMNGRERVLRHGVTSGIAVNGRFMPWLRPHPIPTESAVRDALE